MLVQFLFLFAFHYRLLSLLRQSFFHSFQTNSNLSSIIFKQTIVSFSQFSNKQTRSKCRCAKKSLPISPPLISLSTSNYFFPKKIDLVDYGLQIFLGGRGGGGGKGPSGRSSERFDQYFVIFLGLSNLCLVLKTNNLTMVQ